MRKRRKLTKKRSRRIFRKGAIKTHKKNVGGKVMRGGIRL